MMVLNCMASNHDVASCESCEINIWILAANSDTSAFVCKQLSNG